MAIGINDLDDDLLIDDTPQQEGNQPEPQVNQDIIEEQQDDNNSTETEDDVITAMLRQQGIDNPNEVQYEDSNGQIQKFRFDELPLEDQINILKGNNEQHDASNDLDEDEINLINYLRNNRLTSAEYANIIKNQAIQDYVSNQKPSYRVDDLSDDDLFLLDLKSRVPDINEEDAATALDQAKQNESLFVKQVAGIRQEYQQKEEDMLQQEQAQKQAQDTERLQQFQNAVVSSINKLDQSDDFAYNLDQDDKNQLYNFILTPDQTGMSYLSKALNDPDALVRLSWYALHGDEIVDQIRTYYENQIKETHRNAYAKGFDDGKNGKTTVIFENKKKPTLTRRVTKYKTIDDLD